MNPRFDLEVLLGAILLIGAFAVLARFIQWDADHFLSRAPKRRGAVPPPDSPDAKNEWELLIERAGAVVERAIAELPADVRAEAQSVPVLFEERSERDGGGKVILGIYRGFEPGRVSTRKGPIVLYLRTIEDRERAVAGGFERQVRATFLHELGHHLGWGETEVRERGL